MTDTNMAAIRAAAQALVHQAELAGVVVTIETVPKVPLAMGSYEMQVGVRAGRGAAPGACAVAVPDLRPGIEAAARWVDKRRQDFDSEHGSLDPETGALEFGRGALANRQEDYSNELAEIAEGLRALIGDSTGGAA